MWEASKEQMRMHVWEDFLNLMLYLNFYLSASRCSVWPRPSQLLCLAACCWWVFSDHLPGARSLCQMRPHFTLACHPSATTVLSRGAGLSFQAYFLASFLDPSIKVLSQSHVLQVLLMNVLCDWSLWGGQSPMPMLLSCPNAFLVSQ